MLNGWSTIIVKSPIRCGKWEIFGANLMANCPTKSGVMKFMVKPIPYKMNRKGGGTNNETTQIAADNAKPIKYFSCQGSSKGNTPSDTNILDS